MAAHAYIGDVGFQIFIDTKRDVTGAGSLKIRYRKPDGSEGEWTATATTKNGADGVEYVTTSAADLDQGGTWLLDVEVNGLTGFTGSSSPTSMLIGRPRDGAP